MTLAQRYFVGVDGGATKCIVRIEDEAGNLLGVESSGPANIRLSVAQSWESILTAFERILQKSGLSPQQHFYAGMGLAGCEIPSAYNAFVATAHPFQKIMVVSDAHTACLGAHGGADGAIIIAGTGVVGFQVMQGKTAKVSGWGFPHDDIGGGAWIGLQAVMQTLQWHDQRLPESGLTRAVFDYFKGDINAFVSWANAANSTAFAELAPIVIAQAKLGDDAAIQILRAAAKALDDVARALQRQQNIADNNLPLALIGGITPFLLPYLSSDVSQRLRPCQAGPESGAVMLIRKHIQ